MDTVETAFRAGLQLVRDKGFAVSGGEVPVLAAYRVFTRKSRGIEHEPDYPAQARRYAALLILQALHAEACRQKERKGEDHV